MTRATLAAVSAGVGVVVGSSGLTAEDFAEVKATGSSNSAVRTTAQTETAHFWNVNSVTQFQEALRDLADREVMRAGEVAELFAAVNMTMADSLIVCWRAKYDHGYWRPVTAIRFLYGGKPVRAWAGPGMGIRIIDGSGWKAAMLTFAVIASLLCLWGLHRAGIAPLGNNRKLLVFRGLAGAVSLAQGFYLIQTIPLAAASTLTHLSPIFTTLIAIWFVKEKVAPVQLLFFALSFAGVVAVSLTLTTKGELVVDPEVSVIGLPEQDNRGIPFWEIARDAAIGTVESIPRPRRKDPALVTEAVRRAVRAAINQAWGKKPVCSVLTTVL